VFRTNVAHKIKTHFNSGMVFFKNRGVYEIMWKNIAETGRPRMTIKYGACALHVG